MMNGPGLALEPTVCREIAPAAPGDWEAIRAAFSSAPEWELGQAWLPGPQREFQAGRVRLGWRGERFVYLASFEDADVTTKARERNEPLWERGDVCELFAGEAGSPSYIEYHTAPNGVVLQLRFPHTDPWKTHKLEDLMVTDDEAVQKAREVPGGWEIYGEISGRAVTGREGPLRGQEWEVSVSRYDHNSHGRPPVLSSTSPHREPGFHRRAEWRGIRFE